MMHASTKLSFAKSMSVSDRSVLVQALWISGFALATAIGARVEIVHYPVPYTLQTLFVLLAGAFLGVRNGAISMFLYLGIGALGAPVFSLGGFGLAKILGPTGGYLLAFPAAAAFTGYLVRQHRGIVWSFVSMMAGLMVIFASGTIHLYAFYFDNFKTAFQSGFLLFTGWDLLKLSAAAMIYNEVAKRWPTLPRA